MKRISIEDIEKSLKWFLKVEKTQQIKN
jgi:hypothetical protein